MLNLDLYLEIPLVSCPSPPKPPQPGSWLADALTLYIISFIAC